jgi:hypothetical protein
VMKDALIFDFRKYFVYSAIIVTSPH